MRRLKLLDGFTVKNASVLGFEINTLRVVKVKSCWQLACWCMKSVPMTAYSLVLDATPREKNELSPEHGQRLRYTGYLVSFWAATWTDLCPGKSSAKHRLHLSAPGRTASSLTGPKQEFGREGAFTVGERSALSTAGVGG